MCVSIDVCVYQCVCPSMCVSINENSLLIKPLAHCVVKRQLNIKDRHMSHISKGNGVTQTFVNLEFFSHDLYRAR